MALFKKIASSKEYEKLNSVIKSRIEDMETQMLLDKAEEEAQMLLDKSEKMAELGKKIDAAGMLPTSGVC